MRKFLRLLVLFASMSLYAADAAKAPQTADQVKSDRSSQPARSETPEERHKRMLAEGYRRFDFDGAPYDTVIDAAIDHRGKLAGHFCSYSPLPAYDGLYIRVAPAGTEGTAAEASPRLSLRVATADMRFTGSDGPLAGVTAWAFAPTKRLGSWFYMKATTAGDRKFRSAKWDELAPGEIGYMAIPLVLKARPDAKKVDALIGGFGKSRLHDEAETGDAETQFALGTCYAFENGVAGNRKEAGKWFRKAAAQGHITARGACLLYGLGVGKNPEEAEKLFRGEAEKGDAWAQLLLGWCLGKRDVKDAVGWFRKSALQGNAVAQFQLAVCYFDGEGGIAKDPAEAEKWLKKSAEQGHGPAQIVLARFMKHPPFRVKRGGIDVDKIKAMDLAELKKYQKTVEEKYRAGEVGIEELNLIQSRIIELRPPR